MKKLESYEQYAQVLADFKQGRARCGTNKMMTREEITALIEAGKLYFEEIDGTMWFFSDEGYFYTSWFYAPKDTPIRMRGQDKDVLVELFGNESRYNQQWEDELINTGYIKYDRYVETSSQIADIIDEVCHQNKAMHRFWERRGFSYRTATREDYPELRALWETKLELSHYTLNSMTEQELDEMERQGRCVVICDKNGRICATSMYLVKKQTYYGIHSATYLQGSGLGACSFYETLERAWNEGCTKSINWSRDDNKEAENLQAHAMQVQTGKYYWQFIIKGQMNKAK